MAVQFEMEGERAWTELVAVFFARKKTDRVVARGHVAGRRYVGR